MDLYSDALVSQSQSKMFSCTDYNFFFPIMGNNKLNEATLSLIPLLQHRATGMSVEDWQSNGLLAWIPTELATTPQAASLVLSDKIEAAVLAALNESKREFRVRKGTGYNDQTNALHYLVVKFSDKDAGCELPKDDYFDPACKNSPMWTFYTSFHDSEKIVHTPDLIGSNATGKSYFIRHDGLNGSSLSPVFENSAVHSDAENERMNYAFMQQVSSHLPAWVILYLSPHEYEGLPAVALQQGKVHFSFAKNKADHINR